MAIKLYLLLMLLSNVIMGINIIVNGYYSAGEVAFVFLTTLTSYVIAYIIFYKINRKDYEKNKHILFEVNYRRLNFFATAFLLIMIIYSIRSGDGYAESGNLSSSSIFASLWTVDSFFPMYYCISRGKYPRWTMLNAGIYLVYKILLGWSGSVLMVAIFELHFRFKNKKICIWKAGLITAAALIAGAFIYSYLYPLKYSIRYAMPFSLNDKLNFGDAIDKLMKRFSRIDITLFCNNNMEKIQYLYQSQKINFLEIKATFRGLIPSFIFKNKYFSSLVSCVHNAQSGYKGINITGSPSLLHYIVLLFYCDKTSFIGCCILYFVFLFIIVKMCKSFQIESYQFQIYYFWLVVHSLSINGSLETGIVTWGLKFIFFIPLFIVFAVIKVKYYIHQNVTSITV